MSDHERLSYGRTVFISLAYFPIGLLWGIFNAFVPLILREHLTSTTAVGSVMTACSVVAAGIQPVFGGVSDRTRTRIGRRLPYIVIGAPLSALVFLVIPYAGGLVALVIALLAFTLVMSTWRAPAVALMPDLVPSRLRSQANGVLHLMGGLASILAYGVGGLLVDRAGYGAAFGFAAVVTFVAVALLAWRVKEPSSAVRTAKAEPNPGGGVLDGLDRGQRISLALILATVFWTFLGYNAVELFFTTYAVVERGATSGEAATLLTFYSAAYLVSALPIGLITGRFGRRRVILVGLVGMALTYPPMLLAHDRWQLLVLLALSGVFWSCVVVNFLPLAVELASPERIGAFTGLYYAASFAASIASPVLFGLVRDATGTYGSLFGYAAVALGLAVVALIFVRHGD